MILNPATSSLRVSTTFHTPASLIVCNLARGPKLANKTTSHTLTTFRARLKDRVHIPLSPLECVLCAQRYCASLFPPPLISFATIAEEENIHISSGILQGICGIGKCKSSQDITSEWTPCSPSITFPIRMHHKPQVRIVNVEPRRGSFPMADGIENLRYEPDNQRHLSST